MWSPVLDYLYDGEKICVTGHRPKSFPWNYYFSNLTNIYISAMDGIILDHISNGFYYFISGGALGIDLDFAEAVLRVRKKHTNIKLEIAVPCKNQTELWSERDKLRWNL